MLCFWGLSLFYAQKRLLKSLYKAILQTQRQAAQKDYILKRKEYRREADGSENGYLRIPDREIRYKNMQYRCSELFS